MGKKNGEAGSCARLCQTIAWVSLYLCVKLSLRLNSSVYNGLLLFCFITTCLSICVLKVNLHTNTLFLCFYLNIGTVN